uniref:Uncharacterized protein n=1 Tax=Fagus sylvatica TaxID=28930 RepID=A0A2N9HBA0_FAGSY
MNSMDYGFNPSCIDELQLQLQDTNTNTNTNRDGALIDEECIERLLQVQLEAGVMDFDSISQDTVMGVEMDEENLSGCAWTEGSSSLIKRIQGQEEVMQESSLIDLLLMGAEAVEAHNWSLASATVEKLNYLLRSSPPKSQRTKCKTGETVFLIPTRGTTRTTLGSRENGLRADPPAEARSDTQPVETELPQDHPDLILSGQVCEMAPPSNSFKLMGKTAGASPSETGKGKGKGSTKVAGAGKKLKKSTVDTPVPEVATQTTADQEPPRPPPTVHNLEGSIFVRDTILDDSETELSVQVAQAAWLPEDMKLWDNRHSRQAREEGKEEGMAEGKELRKEGAMDEVKTQFQIVYNSGFRHGWKSALNKTEQPKTSDLFLRTNTPLPYPEAGLKDSGDEADEEEDEEIDDEQGDKDQLQESSQPELTDKMADAPRLPPSL